MLRSPRRPLLYVRLANVLPAIIQVDQYAYVKGRTIFDAVRTIDDIMEYTKIKQIPGLMVAFDLEKAFDSLSWSFLFKALNSFILVNRPFHGFPFYTAIYQAALISKQWVFNPNV